MSNRKYIYFIATLLVLMLSSPVFALNDTGADPGITTPVNLVTSTETVPVSGNLWNYLSYSGKQSTVFICNGKGYIILGSRIRLDDGAEVSNPTALRFMKDGYYIAKREGDVEIKSRIYGDITATIVKPLLSTKKGRLFVGGSMPLTLSGVPANFPVAWESNNQNVVQVYKGKCYAVGPGKAKITACAGGKAYSARITVKDKPGSAVIYNVYSKAPKPFKIKNIPALKKVSFDIPDNRIDIQKGCIACSAPEKKPVSVNAPDLHNLQIYINDKSIEKCEYQLKIGEKIRIIQNKSHVFLNWKSKDPSIAAVSEYGVLIGQGEGNTDIYSKIGKETIHLNVTVHKDPITELKGESHFDLHTVVDPVNKNTGAEIFIGEYGTIIEKEAVNVGNNPRNK